LKIKAQQNKPEKIKQKPIARATGKIQLTEHKKGGKNKRVPLRVTLRAEAATGKVKTEEKPKSLDIILKGIIVIFAVYCFFQEKLYQKT
jgi:hypothetical protein